MRTDDDLYSIGEFAALCDSTIATLLHYETLGLFAPDELRSNGRRFYRSMRYGEFHTIQTLRASGRSLKEIDAYMNEKNLDRNVDFLGRCLDDVDAKLAELQKTKEELTKAVEAINVARRAELGAPRLVRREREPILVEGAEDATSVLDLSRSNIYTLKERLARYYRTCLEHNESERFIPCIYIPRSDAQALRFDRPLFFLPISKEIEGANARVKSEGDYLVMYQYGSFPTDFQHFVAPVMERMQELGATLDGDVYVYPLTAHRNGEGKGLRVLYEAQVPIKFTDNKIGVAL